MNFPYRLPVLAAIVMLLMGSMPALANEVAPVTCPYCELQGQALSGKNFAHANLRGAKLAGLNLSGLDFSGAMLSGANLSGANLSGAILNDADLSGADLSAAVFSGAKMKGADLEYATLAGANFSGTDLSLSKLGPQPKTGIHQGNKTSFVNASLPAGTRLDEASSINSGAHFATAAASPGSAGELSCLPTQPVDTKNLVYVDSNGNGNDSAACGNTLANACKTIAQGISHCSGKDHCSVLVAYGEYQQTSSLQLRDGVNLYGGCVQPGTASSGWTSLIMAPPNGIPAVIANGISSPTIVQSFKIDASPATTAGSPSIALQVANSPGLHVANSKIYANKGAGGANGKSAVEASKGGDASATTGGVNRSCTNSNGGDGSGTMDVQTIISTTGGPVEHGAMPVVISEDKIICEKNGCKGLDGQPGSTGVAAKGGAHGDPNLGSCAYYRGGNGHEGQPGKPGNCGIKGTHSPNVQGDFIGGIWTAAQAVDGVAGGNGGGGGGGGAGGATGGWCIVVARHYQSSSGGGGGAGACGGGGGGGAQQGGASFAVVVLGGALTLTDSQIIAGRSGDGGTGVKGAKGAPGGNMAEGVSSSNSGYGAHGGVGGGSGGGGGGAGGNSGPAAGVALVGGASLNPAQQNIVVGMAGTVGQGGEGAPSSASSCTGAKGDAGIPGLVSTSIQFR